MIVVSESLNYRKSTHMHKVHVDSLMRDVASEIRRRGKSHDTSKFSGIEASLGEMYYEDYNKINVLNPKETDVNTYEKKMAAAHIEHFKRNDHHIEHFENGLSDMNLIQLTELVCDILAHMMEKGYSKHDCVDKIGSILKSRYDAPDELVSIVAHTVEYLYGE